MVACAGSAVYRFTIFRPVRIMGHSQTGVNHEMGDLLPILLRGSCSDGKVSHALDIKVTMVPVDYASQAIVALASRKLESWGRAFHLFNHAPIEWEHMMDIHAVARLFP